MLTDILFSNRYLLFFTFLISLIVIYFINILEWYYLLFLFPLLFIDRINTRFILAASMVTFIVLSRSTFPVVRTVISVLMVSSLCFMFIKKFGFQFKSYPRLPFFVIVFISWYIVTLFVTTIASKGISISGTSFIRTVGFFLICYIFYSLLDGWSGIKDYLNTLLFSVLLVGLSIYSEFIAGGFSFFLENGVLARYFGLYSNANMVGLLIIISTFIIIPMLFGLGTKNPIKKNYLILLLVNNALVMIFTGSRAAVIALILGSSYLLYKLNRRILVKSIVAFLGIAGILLLIPGVLDMFIILLRLNDNSYRESLWNSGIEIFMNNIVFGIGPDFYERDYVAHLPSQMLNLLIETGHLDPGMRISPHNYLILMAAENGIFGIINVIFFVVVYFYINIKSIKLYKNYNKTIYKLLLGFLIIGISTFWRSIYEVSGVMGYGYMAQDLPFWTVFLIIIYLYYNRTKIPSDQLTFPLSVDHG